jgi:hypothetical protein
VKLKAANPTMIARVLEFTKDEFSEAAYTSMSILHGNVDRWERSMNSFENDACHKRYGNTKVVR